MNRWMILISGKKNEKGHGDCVSFPTPNRNMQPPWSLWESASARSPFSPQWYESSSGELRQIETIKRLIWDAPALCVAPTGTERQRWRECAPCNNTTGQCKHRRGKPTIRFDPERLPPGLLCAPGLHNPPYRTAPHCVCTCVRVDRTPADGRAPADRDHAYAPEIALNGRTKALNNAAIISDGVLSIRARPRDRRELFNILAHSARWPARDTIVGYTDICVPNARAKVNIDDAFN